MDCHRGRQGGPQKGNTRQRGPRLSMHPLPVPCIVLTTLDTANRRAWPVDVGTLHDQPPDDLERDVVSRGQRVQFLTGDGPFSNLAFKHRAMRSVLRHGFHSPKARQ
jgi:hypothetical protein